MSRVVEVIQYGTAATGGRRLKVEVGRVGRQGATGATGATGPAGATGATGAQGPAGQGVPVGGSTGQVLSKVSGTDYDTTWSTVSGGGGAPAAHAASHQDGGSDELALDASQLTSGTLATARLGSGTANSGKFLRGDQTWASPTPWTVITDTTLSSAAATFSVTVTGYSVVEVYLTGRSTDTGFAALGMRVLFNSDSGTNYLLNNSAAATVLAPGSIPGSLTNTDRTGIWQASVSLGGVGKQTSLVYRNAYVTSTGTTGLPASSTSGSGHYINTSAAITSMTIYPSSGNWAVGTSLLVLGRV